MILHDQRSLSLPPSSRVLGPLLGWSDPVVGMGSERKLDKNNNLEKEFPHVELKVIKS